MLGEGDGGVFMSGGFSGSHQEKAEVTSLSDTKANVLKAAIHSSQS